MDNNVLKDLALALWTKGQLISGLAALGGVNLIDTSIAAVDEPEEF